MAIDLLTLFPKVKDLDEKSVYALMKAMKNNFDGQRFDYLHFKKSVEALAGMEMTEETSYRSAFTTASTMGLTKEDLLKSAEKYAYVLDEERESFASALLNQKKIKVDGKKAEVKGWIEKIESHKQRIKEMEREIEIFQEKVDNVDQNMEAAALKLEGTKEKFLSVYDLMAKTIKDDISTINKYL